MSSASPPKKPSHPRAAGKATPFSAAVAGSNGGQTIQATRSRLQRSAMTATLRKARRGQTVARRRHMRLSSLGGGLGASPPAPPLTSPMLMPMASPMSAQQMQCSPGGERVNRCREGENPYNRDTRRVEETIEVATSIVSITVRFQDGGAKPPRSPMSDGPSKSPSPLLVREGGSRPPPSPMSDSPSTSLSSLLDRLCVLLTPDDTDDARPSTPEAFAAGGILNRGGAPAGASCDSITAGMAANSILSQFLTEPQGRQVRGPENSLAFSLADALARVLDGAENVQTTRMARIKAAIAINQLAAAEPPPPFVPSLHGREFIPYERLWTPIDAVVVPASWCYVLVHSRALTSLVHRVPSSLTDPGDVELCEKCVWAIGNLAGESETAREALWTTALPRLIRCLSWGIAAQHRSGISSSLLDLMRNCTWALANLVREGGWERDLADILDMPALRGLIDRGLKPRLTSTDVATLLSAPEAFPPLPAADGDADSVAVRSTTTWDDVAVEACWFASFLTREEVAVEFLCAGDVRGGRGIVPALVSRLFHATEAASRQLNNLNGTSIQDIGCLVPCCRALKNVAVASGSAHVLPILLAGTAGTADGGAGRDDTRLAESSLAKLISLGMLGAGGASAVAAEAAALAGACLYAAGKPPPHPPTQACRALLPALCQAMVYQMSTFEFRRNLVWALWNAGDLPPEICMLEDARAVQRDLLAEIIYTLPNGMATALTTMLSSLDASALEASLGLIDALLRRLDNGVGYGQLGGKKLSTLFEEAGLVDALWRICDHDSEESPSAELAAAILDDFYELEEDDAEQVSLQPASFDGQYQFQTLLAPEEGFDFGAPTLLRQDPHPLAMGRGRGSGQVLPAWMQQR